MEAGISRRQIEAERPRFEASRKKRDELSRRFFDAVAGGDTEGLIQLLAADVVVNGDGAVGLRLFLDRSMGARGSSVFSRGSEQRGLARRWTARAMWKSTGSRERCSWIPMGVRCSSYHSIVPTTLVQTCTRSATPTRVSHHTPVVDSD
jgi:hypothetical protein